MMTKRSYFLTSTPPFPTNCASLNMAFNGFRHGTHMHLTFGCENQKIMWKYYFSQSGWRSYFLSSHPPPSQQLLHPWTWHLVPFDMVPTCIWPLDMKIRKSCENITFHSQDANFPKSCGRPVLSSLPFSESISKKLLPNYLYSISKQVLHVLIMAASTTNLFSETWFYEVNVNSEVTIHYKGLVNQKEKKSVLRGLP